MAVNGGKWKLSSVKKGIVIGKWKNIVFPQFSALVFSLKRSFSSKKLILYEIWGSFRLIKRFFFQSSQLHVFGENRQNMFSQKLYSQKLKELKQIWFLQSMKRVYHIKSGNHFFSRVSEQFCKPCILGRNVRGWPILVMSNFEKKIDIRRLWWSKSIHYKQKTLKFFKKKYFFCFTKSLLVFVLMVHIRN